MEQLKTSYSAAKMPSFSYCLPYSASRRGGGGKASYWLAERPVERCHRVSSMLCLWGISLHIEFKCERGGGGNGPRAVVYTSRQCGRWYTVNANEFRQRTCFSEGGHVLHALQLAIHSEQLLSDALAARLQQGQGGGSGVPVPPCQLVLQKSAYFSTLGARRK